MYSQSKYDYDVVLSFAGEDRVHAAELATLLKAKGIEVFYDDFEQVKLWGADLYEYLADVYANKSRYCVMFLSQHYARKLWTNHERRNAQERAFQENDVYILPIKLDDTAIPGIRKTIGYIDLRHHSIEAVANMIQQKLEGSPTAEVLDKSALPVQQELSEIPLPRIRKTFTQLDKDRFLKASFESVKQYFQKALTQLQAHDRDIETDFVEVTSQKFVSKIYVQGNLRCQCKIWISSQRSWETISYAEGSVDVNNDSTMNDYVTVNTDSGALTLRLSNFGLGNYGPIPEEATPEQAAAYLWRRHTAPLA